MKAGLVPGPEPQKTQIELMSLMKLHVALIGGAVKQYALFAPQQRR
jgi:hypothetical protein